MEQEFRAHLQRAVRLCGSQRKLARESGISQQHISYMLREGRNISAEIAVAIDKATKGRVSRKELRPDLFGVKRS